MSRTAFEYEVTTGKVKGGTMDYIELAKAAAIMFFTFTSMLGKTEEEKAKMLEDARTEFEKNKPDLLQDV